MCNEIQTFLKKIDTLKEFLSLLASHEKSIITNGLLHVTEWGSYKDASPIIEDFELDLLEIEELSRFIDKNISDQLLKLKNESKLIENLTTISVQFDIISNKKTFSESDDIFKRIFIKLPYVSEIYKHHNLFSTENISIQKMMVSLSRLSSLVKRLNIIYNKHSDLDDEIFKPSKINCNVLIEKLDEAILDIEINNYLAIADKSRLVNYISAVKIEISGNSSNWNKVIGALVIVATLLGGIATAPKAYENITNVIQLILGTSVEKHIPNILLQPPKKSDLQNDEHSDNTAIT